MPFDYLEMPVDQGSMRFGPLPDVVRIGSDPNHCDVILAPRTGVPPFALELRRSGTSWSMHFPMHPPHPCQLLAQGVSPGHGRGVRDGARVQPGETILITGMTIHPRFQLVRSGPAGLPPVPAESPFLPGLPRDPNAPEPEDFSKGPWYVPRWWKRRQAAKKRRAAMAAQPGFAQSLGQEARRQTESRLLARMPILRNVRDVFWRFRKGNFGEPVMMVGMGIAVISALAAGGVSIVGILWLLGG
jgi:hypothetical protein